MFAPGGRYVVLCRWATADSSGRLFVLDRTDWRVVAEVSVPRFGPQPVASPVEPVVYVDTDGSGVQKLAFPGLELLGSVAGIDGDAVAPTISSDGTRLLAFWHTDETLRLFDLSGDEEVRTWDVGSSTLSTPPVFGPDGRLAYAHVAGHRDSWIIDAEAPADEPISMLDEHRSWIYQMAVSPDGGLLASAAPLGAVLVWDLRTDRVIASFERHASESFLILAHNMDAPLLFAPDGSALLFGEVHPETRKHGITRVDLESGSRTWTDTVDRASTLDALAAMLPPGQPRQLYHHAALLPDGRLAHGYASSASGMRVQVRSPGDTAEQATVFSSQNVTADVSVHPDRDTFAIGVYQRVCVRDARTLEVLHELRQGNESKVYGLAYSPDGSRLAMGTESGKVIILETNRYTTLAELDLPPLRPDATRNYVFGLVWTPDGKRLITSTGKTIRVLESERDYVRDHRRKSWEAELDRARAGNERASEAAKRIAAIEQWAGMPEPEQP
ncbi:MAG: WD40 repeat domain-containing protein [Phycisphaerales bacterium]